MRTDTPLPTHAPAPRHAELAFAGLFSLAVLLFWWLPSLIYRGVLDVPDPVTDGTLRQSAMAALCFAAGYLIALPRLRSDARLDIEAVRVLAGRATYLVLLPALAVAVAFFWRRRGVEYGSGVGLGTWEQAVLYGHLFVGLLYLGLLPREVPRRTLLLALVALTLPRLVVSLVWGRFFLSQAVVPVILLALARGWLELTWRRMAGLVVLALLIIFVPPMARGDSFFSGDELVRFFATGSTLLLYQDNLGRVGDACPPMLVSLTAKTVPWAALQACTIDIWGQRGLPATLDRLLAFDEIGDADALTGPGSNYLLELDVTGGLPAVLIGSFLFGLACRGMVRSLSLPSLFCPIWIECLTRAALAPRGNLGYVFERVPSLLLAYLLVAVLAAGWRVRHPPP